MRLNLTLGSGWPYGGSYVPVNDAAGRLRVVADAVPDGATSLPIPSIRNGEKLLAAFLASGTPGHYDADHAQQLHSIGEYRLTLPASVSGPHVALFFISSRTGQQVKRAAVGAEGFVLDHFSMEAIQNHLEERRRSVDRGVRQEPSLLRLQRQPRSVRVRLDFESSRRVSRAPRLRSHATSARAGGRHDARGRRPALRLGPHARRADRRTLPDARSTLGRASTAQSSARRPTARPPSRFSSNALVDLPEGEGSQWHGPFSFTRWATSASHVVRPPRHFVGNLDLAAFAVVPRHAARYESRGRHFLPAGNQSARGPRLALFTAVGRRSRLVVLRCRRLQQSQSLVDRDAGRDELSHAHELPAAPGQAATNDIAVLLPEEDAPGAFPSRPRLGHRRDAHPARPRSRLLQFSTRATISTSSTRPRSIARAFTIRCW